MCWLALVLLFVCLRWCAFFFVDAVLCFALTYCSVLLYVALPFYVLLKPICFTLVSRIDLASKFQIQQDIQTDS